MHDFMKDYDKLRNGSVSLSVFSRALDICGIHLTEQELLVLQQRYSSHKK